MHSHSLSAVWCPQPAHNLHTTCALSLLTRQRWPVRFGYGPHVHVIASLLFQGLHGVGACNLQDCRGKQEKRVIIWQCITAVLPLRASWSWDVQSARLQGQAIHLAVRYCIAAVHCRLKTGNLQDVPNLHPDRQVGEASSRSMRLLIERIEEDKLSGRGFSLQAAATYTTGPGHHITSQTSHRQ